MTLRVVNRVPITEEGHELMKALVAIFNLTDGTTDASAPSMAAKLRLVRRVAGRALGVTDTEDKGF